MSDKEITRLLTLIDHRQSELTTACKEIANWIDRQGDMPVAGKIRDRLKAVEADEALVKKTLTSLKVERPLPRFR
ncbi:MAG: hypothetical protein ACRESP_00355 [Pseudomonas sp.]|uniref:Uncharacterized protein n=1 Tax=Pseudomonas alkylphenolica TaxID=237609 RepID=A0A443ZR47_9PSED|nr:hypothetical protein [Pseudomonas alkylphenolica]MBH3428382.1 hypothetical protein [Pseudomonas alkylphenolica]RWU21541.1 hypothetical protein DM813_20425 [Pseudomonas alkylphenolica]